MNVKAISSSGSLVFREIAFSISCQNPKALAVMEYPAIKQRLISWMRRESGGFASFEEAAAAVFTWQYERNLPYQRYCKAVGRPSAAILDWREIPALPTDCFKDVRNRPTCIPEKMVARSFLTSGTTQEIKGRHDYADLDLYETSILCGWQEVSLPEIHNPWFLSCSPETAAHSSLIQMFSILTDGKMNRWMMDAAGNVDLSQMVNQRAPVNLFSTAIGLIRLMESQPPLCLPEGSWVFETGGYKGLSETLDPSDFRRRVGEYFGIDVNCILNEYSMTELSSQFYRWPFQATHCGPFWTRIRVMDPETGFEAKVGDVGYLEILDLANLGSVAFIRTQDLAIAHGDAEFVLLGRDPGAIPRGCSRAADDMMKSR